MKHSDEIKRLQEEIRKIDESDENRRRWSFWQTAGMAKDALARPMPKSGAGIPFTVELDRSGYAKALDFSLVEFYRDPEIYLLNSLKINLFRFTQFEDCSPISKTIPYFSGSGFEKSLFGYEQIITEQDAWVGKEGLLADRINIDDLQYPDFYKNPVMKFTHDFCEKMQEMADDDFKVEFPQWNRSSWGLAWQLRGIENLLIDYLEDGEWVEKLLGFLNKARIEWAKQRSAFLNESISPASLYNDEVTVPIVSPAMYRDLILPSETEIGRFYGGLAYWHSCGNTTPLMNMINTIPRLKMVHISPWSDLGTAVGTYSPEKILQINMHPYQDVLQPGDENAITQRLTGIRDQVAQRKATVTVDAVEIVNGVRADMDAIQAWIRAANRIFIQ